MSIPYIPGIGDTLAQYGPDLGKSLQHIINPNADIEEFLKKAMIQNPELADQLTAVEQSNPGSTGIYGKRVQNFFTGRQLSPEFQSARRTGQARATQEEQGVKLNEQSLVSNKQNITLNEDKLKKIKEVNDTIAQYQKEDPQGAAELAKYHAQIQEFGATPETLQELQDKRDKLRQARDASKTAVAFLKGKTSDEVYKSVNGSVDPKTGKYTPPTADLATVGAIRTAPEAEGYRSYERIQLEREIEDARARRQDAADAARAARDKATQDHFFQKQEEARQRELRGLIAKADVGIAGLITRINTGGPAKSVLEKEQAQPLVEQLKTLYDQKAGYQSQLSGKQERAPTVEYLDRAGWIDRLPIIGKKDARQSPGLVVKFEGTAGKIWDKIKGRDLNVRKQNIIDALNRKVISKEEADQMMAIP